MIQTVYEKWVSTDAQREIHFFIAGTDTYVFGINPKYVSVAETKKFLRKQGYRITGLRNRVKDKLL